MGMAHLAARRPVHKVTEPDPHPMSAVPRRSARMLIVDLGVLLGLGALGALAAVLQGMDNNWDFRAYHLYNGWAVLNDRLATDIAPAGAHSFFNPALDAVSYVLLSASPQWGTAALGAWYAVGVYWLYVTWVEVFSTDKHALPRITGLLSALFAGAGGLTVSMAGTTMNETQLVPFLTGAVLAGQRALSNDRRSAGLWALCGALLAAAVGLKFTAATYAVGPLLVLSGWLLARREWRQFVGLSVGTGVGFLLSYGWWGWTLAKEYSSPVFPLYNSVFKSPYAAARDVDLVQMPHSVLDALVAPAQWAWGDPVLAETGVDFQDPRILLGLTTAVAFVVGPRFTAWRPHPLLQGLSACLLASYVVWALVFRVARYTVGMEVLGAFLFAAATVTLVEALARERPQAPVLAMLVVVGLSASVTAYPAWGRTALTVDVDRAAPTLPIPPGALVLLIDRPANSSQLPALIPTLGPDKTYVQPAGMLISPGDGSLLSRRVADAVAKAGHIAVLHYRDRETDFSTRVVRDLGLCLVGPPQDFATPLSGEVITHRPARRC